MTVTSGNNVTLVDTTALTLNAAAIQGALSATADDGLTLAGSFTTNNTNPVWPGWISGHVYDTTTGRSITDALVIVAGLDLPAELHGYYLGQVPAGKYAVTATAGGYQSKSYIDVDVPAGGQSLGSQMMPGLGLKRLPAMNAADGAWRSEDQG